MIHIYNILSLLLLPFYLILIAIRIFKGKEDKSRIKERFGIASRARPDGKLIWLHAVSIGESNMALTLINGIISTKLKTTFLVTSGTRASANILQEKLPRGAIHQFLPIDNIIFVRRFLKYWQPDLAIFIESELWPCLLSEAARVCKLLLFNACISEQSFKRWQKIPFSSKLTTEYFTEIIAQSEGELKKFKALGIKNAMNLGNLKFANKKLEVSKEKLMKFLYLLKNKKIIVLASSHLEDETVMLPLIRPLKEQYPDCYFIVVLRHPERVNEVASTCKQMNLTYSIRSQKDLPLLTDDLYIVDKFGELGLFYSLAYISFIGGSFQQGGHNPLEPAYFGNLIIFGSDMSSCLETADRMLGKKAALQIANKEELFAKLSYFLSPAGIEEAKLYQINSTAFIKENQQILKNYLEIVNKYFTPHLQEL